VLRREFAGRGREGKKGTTVEFRDWWFTRIEGYAISCIALLEEETSGDGRYLPGQDWAYVHTHSSFEISTMSQQS
jgi:hypothetical protein